MGIANNIQDSFGDVTLQDCLWEGVSLTCRIRAQSLLGNKDAEHEYENSQKKRILQLNELEEFHQNAYESSRIYKEKVLLK